VAGLLIPGRRRRAEVSALTALPAVESVGTSGLQ
jgi:hypothetical protein